MRFLLPISKKVLQKTQNQEIMEILSIPQMNCTPKHNELFK